MKLRYAIIAALSCSSISTAQAWDINDWPTKLKTDSGYEFGIKGLYQGDLVRFSGDTSNPATGAQVLQDATTWRRKEFNLYAKAPFGAEVTLGYDFQGRAWIDNYIKYGNKQVGDFRLGQFKTPVGWEEASSSSATTFLERALPVQATNMGRRLGADWTYQGVPGWMFTAAWYSGGDLNGNNDGTTLAGRAVWNPVKTDTDVIHLGLAASRETPDEMNGAPATVRFRAKPETGLTSTRLVDSGSLPYTDHADRVGLEGAWIKGPLLVQGEWLSMSASRSNGKPDYSADGFYVFGAWMLTGESRTYKSGYIGNVKPARDWGAVEIALRYSSLDLNDGIVRGGKQHDWTLGANWYLTDHFKLQANYIRATSNKYYPQLEQAANLDPNIFQVRAQLYF